MFKKSLVMIFALVISIIPVASASASNIQELTNQEISSKFEEINSKYQINERFSDEDASFVKKYAQVSNSSGSGISLQGFLDGNRNFSISGDRSVGLSTVSVVGRASVSNGPISTSVDMSMTAKDDSKRYHTSMTNQLTFTGYGIVGADGIGIVANRDMSFQANNANYNKYQDTQTFYGLIVYYMLNAKVIVQDGSQRLTLEAVVSEN